VTPTVSKLRNRSADLGLLQFAQVKAPCCASLVRTWTGSSGLPSPRNLRMISATAVPELRTLEPSRPPSDRRFDVIISAARASQISSACRPDPCAPRLPGLGRGLTDLFHQSSEPCWRAYERAIECLTKVSHTARRLHVASTTSSPMAMTRSDSRHRGP
jgi:hypothetical protein